MDIADHPLMRSMCAEYEDACKAIDARANDVAIKCLQDAMQALLAGDTATRDKLCDNADRAYDTARQAKLEAGLRIAERYGMDRDEIEQAVRSMQGLN